MTDEEISLSFNAPKPQNAQDQVIHWPPIRRKSENTFAFLALSGDMRNLIYSYGLCCDESQQIRLLGDENGQEQDGNSQKYIV